MRRSLMSLAAVASLLFAGQAQADNHFILELEGGVTDAVGTDVSDPGKSVGGTFGFGGRIPGSKPAYYFIGRFGASDFTMQGSRAAGSPIVQRDQTEWALGGRMYLPISDRFRALLQISIGETQDRSEIHYERGRPMLVDDAMTTVFTQAGLQYRFTNHFALGAMADLAWYPENEGPGLAALGAGLEDDDREIGRTRFALTSTFHF